MKLEEQPDGTIKVIDCGDLNCWICTGTFPAAPLPSAVLDQPLAIHQPPAKQEQPLEYDHSQLDGDFWHCFICETSGGTNERLVAKYGFPKSSGIPSTARAILDIVPERKTPSVTPAQQQQGEGIARAVKNLTFHENRLGASRWHP